LIKRVAFALITPLVTALVLVVDQLSKRWVLATIPEGQSLDVVPWLASVFTFTHVTNTGVAFGLFQGMGYLFVAISVVVVVVILIYQRHLPQDRWLIRVALGLQLAGAIGNNLIDRVRLGHVVDFIDLTFWPLATFPVFNVADSSIVVGVILLAVLMLIEECREQRAREAAQEHV